MSLHLPFRPALHLCLAIVAVCCQATSWAATPNPCATSHKVVFYNNDFSYLNDPCYCGDCLGDCMKQMRIDPCGHWGKLDIGGQLRLRYHHEDGMGRQPGVSGFNDTKNDFLLTRLRLYTNWEKDWLRVYAEGITAEVTANDLYVPRPIDINAADFLNLFADVAVTDSLTVRVGRQELLYGVQRHVSPLDWANTRRTFSGVKLMYTGDTWNVDGFFTNYVPVDPYAFDEPDYQQKFYGIYATRMAQCGGPNVDLFYLGYDNDNQYSAPPTITTAGTADFSVHTFGTRFWGEVEDGWLYEVEATLQAGRQSGLGLDHRAGMCTCGFGKKLDMPWSPTIWAYYDFASGNKGDGSFNRYNQLFPLAHKYLGFIDAAQRSNISSPNCLLTMSPSSKWSLLAWYYYLGADEANDIIPFVATPSVQNTDTKYFGHELDLIATYKFAPSSNVLFGYSNLWRGSKIIGTNDAHFFYTQWETNF
ncbi:alginate export family protein [Aeoliella sp. ICT_H6.2]|uniref:Alginate export family protein n=1 Tax=Aeoliella straminimaris TaxID=2954799 RepID=A0A9X2JF55_9BACT|nr:alginate export family protein [Aeoliella straminimaris]